MKNVTIWMILSLLCCMSVSFAPKAQEPTTNQESLLKNGVVMITGKNNGAGFILYLKRVGKDTGRVYIITAKHIIKDKRQNTENSSKDGLQAERLDIDNKPIMPAEKSSNVENGSRAVVTFRFVDEEKPFPAKIMKEDEEADLALLYVDYNYRDYKNDFCQAVPLFMSSERTNSELEEFIISKYNNNEKAFAIGYHTSREKKWEIFKFPGYQGRNGTKHFFEGEAIRGYSGGPVILGKEVIGIIIEKSGEETSETPVFSATNIVDEFLSSKDKDIYSIILKDMEKRSSKLEPVCSFEKKPSPSCDSLCPKIIRKKCTILEGMDDLEFLEPEEEDCLDTCIVSQKCP